MNAYSGKEPYVFVSYCHLDKEKVEKIIIELKRKMCRVWYDEGLTLGESWNDDLALHLNNSDCVLALLTENSVKSRYVMAEINFAMAHDKKIIPIKMDNCTLPAGLELMLGQFQMGDTNNEDDIQKLIAGVLNVLPQTVFASKKIPFYEMNGYSFFLEKYNIPHSYKPKTSIDGFSIICKDIHEQKKELFDFQTIPAYDVQYEVTQCKEIKDDYFVGKIHGIVLFNILAKCELEYPLYGPDFDVLMIFALRIPESSAPTVKLIDYQYMHIIGLDEGDKISNSAWSQEIEKTCQEKLYQ